MEEDTVVRLPRPGASVADDPLLEVLRSGARRMLQQVIEAEVEAFLAAPAELEDAHGRRRVVRPVGFADITPWDRAEPDGHAPEREIQTGIGPIAVRRPKLRDRGDSVNSARIRFTSKVLPPFLRRTRNVEELLPSGLGPIPRRDVSKADRALPQGRVDRPVRGGAGGALGPRRTRALGLDRAPPRRGLLTAGPPDMDRRLCWPPMVATWQQDHERWQRRDRSARRYVYVWANGVYFTPRLEHERQCILVLIGADASGRKELLAIEDGFRESAQSWKELLLRLRDENGLVLGPELATGDGALGFWQALHEVWPTTRQQRCWVHKTANVLNVLPKSVQGPGSCAAVLAEGSRERDGQEGPARHR